MRRPRCEVPTVQPDPRRRSRLLVSILPGLLALAVLNAVSTLIECGPTICADPPTSYKLIDELGNNN